MDGITGITISMTPGILITTILGGITGTIMHLRRAGRMDTIISTIRFATTRKLLLFNPGSAVGIITVFIILGAAGITTAGIRGITMAFPRIAQMLFIITGIQTIPAIMTITERM